MKTKNLPWIEKYRPANLDDIISHTEIIDTLKKFIKSKTVPHLLFYGPPGTGKTSTITACAKELYGDYYQYMVMELNASDDRGIDVVRSKIKQFVASQNIFYKNKKERDDIFKLVILDETDAMTGDAQAILRKVVEDYTYNTRFCLICNYIQNIIPALQSRCVRFRFPPLSKKDIEYKIVTICKVENVDVTKDGINTLIRLSRGDMRKVLNNLQSVYMTYEMINEDNVNACLGYPNKEQITIILNTLLIDTFKTSYETITKIKKEIGLSLEDIMQELHDTFLNYILTEKTANKNLKKLDTNTIANILDNMRIIDFNQSVNTDNNIQVAGLISIFKSL